MRALIFAAALALAACSRGGEMEASAPPPPPMAAHSADMAVTEAYAGEAANAAAQPEPSPAGAERGAIEVETEEGRRQATPGPAAPAMFLAYSYAMGIETPANRLIAVMDAHTAACREAGPQVCQIISAGRDGDADTYLTGTLNLRAEPRWLATFMARIAADAEQARGRVRSTSTSTEDLTRAIIDTEARLRAMTTLRDRLQNLLASRPGRLSDLLDVERELARVQGELDSTRSNLAAMRARVDMSALSVNYQSEPRSVTTSTFEPLGQAFANFLRNVVGGIAAIVTLIAVALPWLIVVILALWGLRAVWRMRRARRAAAPDA